MLYLSVPCNGGHLHRPPLTRLLVAFTKTFSRTPLDLRAHLLDLLGRLDALVIFTDEAATVSPSLNAVKVFAHYCCNSSGISPNLCYDSPALQQLQGALKDATHTAF